MQSRGGVGIINIQTTERNGSVVGIAHVEDDDELMLITQHGKVLRMDTKDLRTIGRATQGVRLIGIDSEDQVVSLARLGDVSADEAGDGGESGTASDADERADAPDDSGEETQS